MGVSAGIVGLPNVGKSTLFNAMTSAGAEAANYPFATIEPNVGIVSVPDERLEALGKLINPKKLTFTTFKFTDIAGLVKGASKGEGLGNKFLGSIRETDAICHVLRCFADTDIVHVEKSVDPVRDAEIVNTELVLSDIEIVQNRVQRISKKAQSGDHSSASELAACSYLLSCFDKSQRPDLSSLTEDQRKTVAQYNLISTKPVIYVANVGETDLADPEKNEHYRAVVAYAKEQKASVVAISAKIESELVALPEVDRVPFMKDLGLSLSGIQTLSRKAFDLLGLRTFFTFGPEETRAWTFTKGMTAPQCAGVIHSDFERGFIKASVVNWKELVELGGEQQVKDAGKMRTEGKDYLVQDGDVCHFRFNVTK